jgi:type I restriction enzyme S subunit
MDWNVSKLSELCKIQTGRKDVNSGSASGKYPFFTCAKQHTFSDEYSFDCEALLIAGNGVVGNTSYFNGKFEAYQRTYVLSDFVNVIPQFLFLLLDGVLKDSLVDKKLGNTMPYIKVGMLKDFLVPLPPIPEQQRIVTILDQAFADIEKARANAEKNLKNARELFDSYLNQVFSQRGEGWVERSLGEVCDFLNGFAFKSSDALDESNVQLIRMGNLYKNVLALDRKPSFYPSGFADEYKKYLLTEGDLIISLTGTTGKRDYGFTVEVPACDRQLLLNQRIAKIKAVDSNQIQKRFLLRILKSPFFLDELYASANGTRQANLSTSALKDIAISFPSIERQIELIAVFESIDQQCHDLKVTYKTKLKALDELKKSLLQKAFSGELTKTEGMVA